MNLESSMASQQNSSVLQKVLSSLDNGAILAVLSLVFLFVLRSVTHTVAPNNLPSVSQARTAKEMIFAARFAKSIDDSDLESLVALTELEDPELRQAALDALYRFEIKVGSGILARIQLSELADPPHPLFLKHVSAKVCADWSSRLPWLSMSERDFSVAVKICAVHRRSKLVGSAVVQALTRQLRLDFSKAKQVRALKLLKTFHREAIGSLVSLFGLDLAAIEWQRSILNLSADSVSPELLAMLRRLEKQGKVPTKIRLEVLKICLENGPSSEQLALLERIVSQRGLSRLFHDQALPSEALRIAVTRTKSLMTQLNPQSQVGDILPALGMLELVYRSKSAASLISRQTASQWLSALQTIVDSISSTTWRRCAFQIGEAIAFLDHDQQVNSWIQDSVPRLRFLATIALEHDANDEARQLLLTLCNDNNEKVRLQAALALSRSGDIRGLSELLKIAQNCSKMVAEHAALNIDFIIGKPSDHDLKGMVAVHLKTHKSLPVMNRQQATAPQSRLIP